MDEFIWIPDWNAQGSYKEDISKVRFGDGYVQRQKKGINTTMMTWSLTFNSRSEAESDAIMEFLREREGVVAFTWTPPGEDQFKWTCESYSRNVVGAGISNISATFERVYEP